MDALIIGTAPQGLFINRLLSSKGKKTIIVTTNKKLGFYSRYGVKIHAPSEAQFRKTLIEIYRDFGNIDCYLTSGPELSYVVMHFPELFEMFNVSPRPLNDLRLLADKMNTYALAKQCGVNTLFSVHSNRIVSTPKIPMPCIVKWNNEASIFESSNFKTYVANSEAQLYKFLDNFTTKQLQRTIVQEFISSPQSHNFSYLAYYENGYHRFGILVQQIRQYPQGITSYLKEYCGLHSKALIEQSEKLMCKTNYTGFCEIEYKFDAPFKKFYLLEVNPRPCGWASALSGKFNDVVDRMYGKDNVIVQSKPVAWVNIQRDVLAVLVEFKKNKNIMQFYQNIISIITSNCIDVYDREDIKPFLQNFLKFLRN